jgi:ABC transporter related protein
MLNISGLSKSFGARVLWSDLDVAAGSGTMTALTGVSGAGKSTLLNCIGLLETPDSGSILFEGRDILRLSGGEVRRFRREILGYLFQNYALVEDSTVLENLEMVLGRRRARESLSDLMGQVGLEGREKSRVATLSGGEQQRVALARVIGKTAKLILADEPTGALDSENSEAVVGHLRRLAKGGATVLVATHDRAVWETCDQVIRLG